MFGVLLGQGCSFGLRELGFRGYSLGRFRVLGLPKTVWVFSRVIHLFSPPRQRKLRERKRERERERLLDGMVTEKA